MKEYRIAAAAIVMQHRKVLLVRYHNKDGNNFLVGPGGGIHVEESLPQAVVREVKEETGIEVQPSKMLFVEDLLSERYRMIKIWFLCNVVGGQLIKTQEAQDEGIVEVGWYEKEQLKHEIVYPAILKEVDWDTFFSQEWQFQYIDLKKANF
ncbi:MAG: NUDIX domain-containing protein [bacterium]